MSSILPKAPKPPAYVPPPATPTAPDMNDPTINRSASFAARAGGDSFVGGKLNRKASTVKSELTGN
jgi:hypothetical protein